MDLQLTSSVMEIIVEDWEGVLQLQAIREVAHQVCDADCV